MPYFLRPRNDHRFLLSAKPAPMTSDGDVESQWARYTGGGFSVSRTKDDEGVYEKEHYQTGAPDQISFGLSFAPIVRNSPKTGTRRSLGMLRCMEFQRSNKFSALLYAVMVRMQAERRGFAVERLDQSIRLAFCRPLGKGKTLTLAS